MKRSRALHHLHALAEACATMAERPSSIFPLQVIGLWAAGEVLEPVDTVEVLVVALQVDLPPEATPWLCAPPGATHWANAVRLPKLPIVAHWRSVHASVWNHHLVRPLLVWSVQGGVRDPALAALAGPDRDALDALRGPAPTPEQLRERLEQELFLAQAAVRERSEDYQRRRWAPGKLEPVADALADAVQGWVDLQDALDHSPRATGNDRELERPGASEDPS
jgi:hypothetical protein